MKVQQRLADGLRYQLPDVTFAMKLHFAFRRMNIDVDRGGIQFQEQATNWVAPFHQSCVISFQQSKIEPPILHRPTIDEQMVILSGCPRYTRCADKTRR